MQEIGKLIRSRRIQLNLSQQQLADLMGYQSRSTITKIEKSKQDIPRSKVSEFAKALKTTPEYLMGWEEVSSEMDTMQKLKETFSTNLQFYLDLNNKSQMDLCRDLNFTSSTVSDWINAKKYPRMDKVQILADYFHIRKSDLIEDPTEFRN